MTYDGLPMKGDWVVWSGLGWPVPLVPGSRGGAEGPPCFPAPSGDPVGGIPLGGGVGASDFPARQLSAWIRDRHVRVASALHALRSPQ